jgi:hypothetical protein
MGGIGGQMMPPTELGAPKCWLASAADDQPIGAVVVENCKINII